MSSTPQRSPGVSSPLISRPPDKVSMSDADTHQQHPQGQKVASWKRSATGPSWWLMAFVCGLQLRLRVIPLKPVESSFWQTCSYDETQGAPPPPPRTTHLTVRQPISSTRSHQGESYGTLNINLVFVVHSNNLAMWLGHRLSYCVTDTSGLVRVIAIVVEGWSIHGVTLTALQGACPVSPSTPWPGESLKLHFFISCYQGYVISQVSAFINPI